MNCDYPTSESLYQELVRLRHAGYTWKRITDIGTAEDDLWQIYSPTGEAVTLSEALAVVAAATATISGSVARARTCSLATGSTSFTRDGAGCPSASARGL